MKVFQTTVKKIIRTIQNEGFKALIYKTIQKIKNSNGRLYKLWIEQNEVYSSGKEKVLLAKLKIQPMISIVTPVFNPRLVDLQKVLTSVEYQYYENWELCLADASTKPEIREFLMLKQKENPKIKVNFLKKNISIASNTNEAIKLAKGEYIGFLDHDDTLAPFALSEVIKKINENPKIDLFYSDEDKVNSNERRFLPNFKPNWSPDLLNSFNYITHFVVARASLVKEIGGVREGFEGAQDYDFLLRLTEKTNKIFHIPKILYHWRIGRNSTAGDISAKSYAIRSGQKALEDKLKRQVLEGSVELTKYPCLYRVRYKIKDNPKVSIIIPTKDKVEILKRCINSLIKKTTYPNYEIIIVDNQSKEKETREYLNKVKGRNLKIIEYKNEFNFSALNNFASNNVTGDYLVFLNNDTEVITNDWIESMLEHAQRPEVGVVGAKLYYPDNSIQHAGVILGLGGGFAGHAFALLPKEATGYFARLVAVQNYLAVTGACMMVRKNVFEEVGGFDENLQLAFNDVDLCLKIFQKGYRIVWTPYSEFYHHESSTRGYDVTPEQKVKFSQETDYARKKWEKYFPNGDPYFNQNLSLKYTDFIIKINE